MLRVIVSGDDPPLEVIAAAAEVGVELLSEKEHPPAQGVHGYLMNSYGKPPTPATADVLAQLPDLRIVIYLGQSMDPMDYSSFVDLDRARSHGIALATTPGGDAVAEATIGMIIAADVNLVAAATNPAAVVRRRGLAGATLGIVGFGQIGRRVAELGSALGMKIRYASRREHPEIADRFGAQPRRLDRLCAESDFLSVHTSNSAPAGLIGPALGHAAGGFLINTTSAPRLVDPASLLSALENGTVRRAMVEGSYPDPWQGRLQGCGIDRYVSVPAYSSWDTDAARATGWNQAIAALSAAQTGRPIAHRLI